MLVVSMSGQHFCFAKQEQNHSVSKILTGNTFVKQNMLYQKKGKENTLVDYPS